MGLQFLGVAAAQGSWLEASRTCQLTALRTHHSLSGSSAASRRVLTLLKLLSVVVLVSVMAGATAHGQGTAATTTRAALDRDQIVKARKSILVHTNRERTLRGLAPLRSTAALNYVAQAQSANMCAALRAVDRNRRENKCALPNFNHESDLFPHGWRAFGERLRIANLASGAENIACRTLERDLDKWAQTIVRGWMTSKLGHHKKNILNRKFRFLGVGVVGCIERIGYATQVFSDQPGRIRHDQSSRYTRQATAGKSRRLVTRSGSRKQ